MRAAVAFALRGMSSRQGWLHRRAGSSGREPERQSKARRNPAAGETKENRNVQYPRRKSNGAGARSRSRPARSRVRPTAPCSPPMAKPLCWPPWSAPRHPKEGVDFFPLTVNYQERYYAAGKIPGGYFKRERAPTERETLTSRLIDRPIRPLFAEGYQERDAGRRAGPQPRPGKRSRYRRPGRGFRRADHFRHSLHGPDRGGARRLYQRRIRAQSADRRRCRIQARPRRRRHARRGADGGIRSPGAVAKR